MSAFTDEVKRVKALNKAWRAEHPEDYQGYQEQFKMFPDGCYAVVKGNRRGPSAHDKPTALARFQKSGLIAPRKEGN